MTVTPFRDIFAGVAGDPDVIRNEALRLAEVAKGAHRLAGEVVSSRLKATDPLGYDSAPETNANEIYCRIVDGERGNFEAVAGAATAISDGLNAIAEVMDGFYADMAAGDEAYLHALFGIALTLAGFIVSVGDPEPVSKVIAIAATVLEVIGLVDTGWSILHDLNEALQSTLTTTLPPAPPIEPIRWQGVPRG